MAKKNLASLMSGIMGEPAPVETKSIETPKPIETPPYESMPIEEAPATPAPVTIQKPINAVEISEDAVDSIAVTETSEAIEIPQPTDTTTLPSKPRTKKIEAKNAKEHKPKATPYEEIRATFIVNPEHVRKIKYISLVEGNMLKDVIEEALSSYIKSWEAENERIRLPRRS